MPLIHAVPPIRGKRGQVPRPGGNAIHTAQADTVGATNVLRPGRPVAKPNRHREKARRHAGEEPPSLLRLAALMLRQGGGLGLLLAKSERCGQTLPLLIGQTWHRPPAGAPVHGEVGEDRHLLQNRFFIGACVMIHAWMNETARER